MATVIYAYTTTMELFKLRHVKHVDILAMHFSGKGYAGGQNLGWKSAVKEVLGEYIHIQITLVSQLFLAPKTQ